MIKYDKDDRLAAGYERANQLIAAFADIEHAARLYKKILMMKS